jgi:hypothetical protein
MRSLIHPLRDAHASRPIGLPRDAAERWRAEALLGPDHPLVRVLRGSRTTVDAMVAVVAVTAVGGGLAIARARYGLPVALAGAVVQAALTCRLACCASLGAAPAAT